MAKLTGADTHHPRFEAAGMLDFLNWLDRTPAHPAWERNGMASQRVSDDEGTWSATKTFADAVRLAHEGWPEGRDKLRVAAARAAKVTVPMLPRSERMDVAGAYPHVPMAAAGEPTCMVDRGDDMTARAPVLDVWLNSFISSGTSQDACINHGSALLAALNEIENAGRRVAITLCFWSGASARQKHMPNDYEGNFQIKAPDQPVDIDRLAFTLAHPAMMRRLWFAALERCPGLVYSHDGYGGVVKIGLPPPSLPVNALYLAPLGYKSQSTAACQTPEGAVAWVNRQIDAHGFLEVGQT